MAKVAVSNAETMSANDNEGTFQVDMKKKTEPLQSKRGNTKKPVWKSVLDTNSGKFYYYNRHTRKSTWEKPRNFDEDLMAYRNNLKQESGKSQKEARAQQAQLEQEELQAELAVHEGDIAASLQEEARIERRKGEELQALAESERLKEEEMLAELAVLEGAEMASRMRAEAEAKVREEARKKQEETQKELKRLAWRSYVDPRSGKTYYFCRITQDTTWDKPTEFDETLDQEILRMEEHECERACKEGRKVTEGELFQILNIPPEMSYQFRYGSKDNAKKKPSFNEDNTLNLSIVSSEPSDDSVELADPEEDPIVDTEEAKQILAVEDCCSEQVWLLCESIDPAYETDMLCSSDQFRDEDHFFSNLWASEK